jgi:hypothetical protein
LTSLDSIATVCVSSYSTNSSPINLPSGDYTLTVTDGLCTTLFAISSPIRIDQSSDFVITPALDNFSTTGYIFLQGTHHEALKYKQVIFCGFSQIISFKVSSFSKLINIFIF